MPGQRSILCRSVVSRLTITRPPPPPEGPRVAACGGKATIAPEGFADVVAGMEEARKEGITPSP